LLVGIPVKIPFSPNLAAIDSSRWPFPPVFNWLKEKTEMDDLEMLSTFNCGVGMIGIVHPDKLPDVLSHLNQTVTAWEVGQIVESDGEPGQVSWR